ncbi:xanthine dehydrogenase family protein molybdopterin-binding subunit [Pseudohoeflea coraliihabitans]|uniref:Xanthine dehydrogenase family protein molybdopterin-binding subunit n=1 Tax=Pseudohoeflea coraliihabitans TaxID=2860393 RepID=A0ABS6WKX8_9HYPH|nr:xanthine dehydrogenase family protein molybdopterin-binding subunit [Pseudohoeflea sp. DP4N28-3]MBW3096601.1 xanthine dehydrogenase family protein molybdopterin-binding subunit [Pseudohoeflea sp. DP4N28-3]
MNDRFKMDEAQPRLLDSTGQGIIGTEMDRPDGRLKVCGAAPYAAEFAADRMAHGVLVRATVSKGRVLALNDESIREMPGFLGLFHDGTMLRNSAQGMAGEAPVQPGLRVDYHGQSVAVVVAETFEQARDAAQQLAVRFEAAEEVEVDPETAEAIELDEDSSEQFGDLEAAMAEAVHTVDSVYTTPGHVSAAMEPHASLAEWHEGNLSLHGSYQMLRFNKKELADSLGVDADRVRILAPFVGGGFGSKLGIGAEAVAAAVAARELDRPVRVVMARQQVFDCVLRRTETRQRLRLAADEDGRLSGVGHEDRISQLPEESFGEPTATATHFMYGGKNRLYRKEIARIHRTPSGSVRAPGEAVGMLGLEGAMDELAEVCGIDPVELRLRNIPDTHPETGKPYSSRSLAECLKQGASQFGWENRPAAGSRREGQWYIGCGVASAARSNSLVRADARVTLSADGAIVETDLTDIGTGSYAILTQIAAEMLGLPASKVTTRLGDTDLPGASGSGGSFGAGSTGSAVFLAAKKIRARLAEKLGCDVDSLTLKDGVARGGNVEKPLRDLCVEPICEEAGITAGKLGDDYEQASFGAHFAEVAVHADSGEVRVRRMLGVFAAGRILNVKTARSQCIGGMVWGIGSALMEELGHDPRTGHIITRDLANYHIASNADVPLIDVHFIEERDDQSNPIQSKAIGELSISGAGAAVVNAIYNACGVRIRAFPATPDKVVAGLEALGL